MFDLFSVFIGFVLFVLLSTVCQVIIVLISYFIDSQNLWYRENYEQLPKFLRIFDKEDK